MIDTLLRIQWSEVAAAIGIITVFGSVVLWLLQKAGDGRYLQKKAFYAQRREDEEAHKVVAKDDKKFREDVLAQLESLSRQFASLEAEQRQAAVPMQSVAESLAKLTEGFDGFKTEVAKWRLDMEKQLAVVEDRQNRSRGRRSGD